MSLARRHPVVKYFLEARCACDLSVRYKNSLCLSALTFLIPASVLLHTDGVAGKVLGGLTLNLTATSLWYHSTHAPRARACDVSTILATAAIGLGTADASLVASGIDAAGVYFLAAHGILAFVIVVSYHSAFHFVNVKGDGVIRLPWHVAMHLLTAATLLLIALGIRHT